MAENANLLLLLCVGVCFAGIILALAFLFPEPSDFQYLVCRVLLAFACCAMAALVPGLLNIEIPGFAKASGALAVFLLVYRFTPASLVVQPRSRRPSGHNSDPDIVAGDQVVVLASGQRSVTIEGVGVVGWADEMKNYRGQRATVREASVVFDREPVFRLDIDGGKSLWHRQWLQKV